MDAAPDAVAAAEPPMALLPAMVLPVIVRVSASLSIAPPEPLPPPGPPWAEFSAKVLPWIVSVPGT